MRATNIITQGWKMAEVNADGSRATTGQRAFNFMANGGGTVTFRTLVPTLLAVIGALLGLMWNDLKSGQDRVVESVTEQGKLIVGNTTRIDAMQSSQQKIWLKLGAHDSQIEDTRERVTRLEACQPNCAPK